MPTYSRETSVAVPASAAYAYLSEVGNLPEYFPMMTGARTTSGDEVETTAVIQPPTPRTSRVVIVATMMGSANFDPSNGCWDRQVRHISSPSPCAMPVFKKIRDFGLEQFNYSLS